MNISIINEVNIKYVLIKIIYNILHVNVYMLKFSLIGLSSCCQCRNNVENESTTISNNIMMLRLWVMIDQSVISSVSTRGNEGRTRTINGGGGGGICGCEC